MPIRFRCAYCNQLMGISRRKAGTVVRCPKCAGEIIVPGADAAPEPEPEPEETGEKSSAPQPFENPQFEQIFSVPAHGSAPLSATAPTETAPAAGTNGSAPVPPAPATPARRLGLFLPLGMLFVSVGVVVLLLILMFVLGLIIGRATVAGT